MLRFNSNGRLIMTQIKFPITEKEYDVIIDPLKSDNTFNQEFFDPKIKNCSVCHKLKKDCMTHLVGLRTPFYFINPSFSATILKIMNNICLNYNSSSNVFEGCCIKLNDKKAKSCKSCGKALDRTFQGAASLIAAAKKETTIKKGFEVYKHDIRDLTTLKVMELSMKSVSPVDITKLFLFDEKLEENPLVLINFENSLRELGIRPSLRLSDFVFDIVTIPPPELIPYTQPNNSNAAYKNLYDELLKLDFSSMPTPYKKGSDQSFSKCDLLTLQKFITTDVQESKLSDINTNIRSFITNTNYSIEAFSNYYQMLPTSNYECFANLPSDMVKFKMIYNDIERHEDIKPFLATILYAYDASVISAYCNKSNFTKYAYVEVIKYLLYLHYRSSIGLEYTAVHAPNTFKWVYSHLLDKALNITFYYAQQFNPEINFDIIKNELYNELNDTTKIDEYKNTFELAVNYFMHNIADTLMISNKDTKTMIDARNTLNTRSAAIVTNLLTIIPPIISKDETNTTLFMSMPDKKGIYRESLIAKQTTNCARTVVGPSEANFGDFEIPYYYNSLLLMVDVNKLTIKIIKDLANYGFIKYILKYGETYFKKYDGKIDIEVGDKVYRGLLPGDPIIMNRQPTLHAHSVLAHFVQYTKDPVVRLHPMCTKGYAADFDGDEMNTFISMSIESQLELMMFLHCNHMIISGNKPIIGPMFHELTVLYHMSMRADDEIDDNMFMHYMKLFYKFDYNNEVIEKLRYYNTSDCFKPVTIYKPGMNVPKNFDVFGNVIKPKLTKNIITTAYTIGKELPEEIVNEIVNNKTQNTYRKLLSMFFPIDFNYTKDIKRGIFVGKSLTDKNMSIGNGHIVHQIHHRYEYKYCARMLTYITHICASFMRNMFLSMTLDYFALGKNHVKYEDIKRATIESKQTIIDYQNKLDEEKSQVRRAEYEDIIKNVGMAPYKAAQTVFEGLKMDPYDAFLMFIMSGARGDYKSLQQITMSLGQQFNGNSRVNATNLPQLQRSGDLALKHGYIYGNFNDGMSPVETIIHSVVVRDSIIRGKMEVKYVGDMANCIASCLGQSTLSHNLGFNVNETLVSLSLGGLLDPSKLIRVSLKTGVDVCTFIDIDNEFEDA